MLEEKLQGISHWKSYLTVKEQREYTSIEITITKFLRN